MINVSPAYENLFTTTTTISMFINNMLIICKMLLSNISDIIKVTIIGDNIYICMYIICGLVNILCLYNNNI